MENYVPLHRLLRHLLDLWDSINDTQGRAPVVVTAADVEGWEKKGVVEPFLHPSLTQQTLRLMLGLVYGHCKVRVVWVMCMGTA